MADYEPVDDTTPAPTLDFRFSNFYLSPQDYHYWSGLSEDQWWITSPDSSVFWTLRDCAMHGGHINVGCPDYFDFGELAIFAPGQIAWMNNLFDHVAINLAPTFYWDVGVTNSDMQVQAYNNLFRAGWWFVLEPNPASAGNWVFRDNLLDKVDVWQDTAQPLDARPQRTGRCPPRNSRSARRARPTAWCQRLAAAATTKPSPPRRHTRAARLATISAHHNTPLPRRQPHRQRRGPLPLHHAG